MTPLPPQADQAVRHAVDAYIDGRLLPVFEGEGSFDTRNSTYRLLDGVLLDPESLELAWTSQTTSDGKATGYGCGFRVETLAGRRIVSHGGAQPRVSTLLWIDRDRGVVIALMANLEGAARALRELALALAS